MKKVAFYTLGCKVNQYETEAVSRLFENNDYEIVNFDDVADVYVINTCTVTNLSDRKSRQAIRKAKRNNIDSIVAVIGCYAQTAPDEVLEIQDVNLVVGTKDRYKIIEYIKEIENGNNKLNKVDNIMKTHDFEELSVDIYKDRTRAFLKIQEGCSQYCTYCIIPYARGPIRSRLPEDVLNEVKKLGTAGFKEVVLTGIHIASYGKDIKNTSLLDIIKRVHDIDSIKRIRLGSIEPTTITDEFVEQIKKMDKLCPHFHISLQSGCDETLKRMNRKYSTQEYKKGVELLRENIKDVSITTDVMVGFPGETDEEFQKTYSFLEEIEFAKMHIFKYSPRKGTPAATFPNQVKPQIKEERSNKLLVLSDRNAKAFNNSFLNRRMPILFEQEVTGQEGMIEGATPNYIKVICEGEKELKGEIVDVKLMNAVDEHIIGQIIK